jgi:uncharacterized protein with PIN domain
MNNTTKITKLTLFINRWNAISIRYKLNNEKQHIKSFGSAKKAENWITAINIYTNLMLMQKDYELNNVMQKHLQHNNFKINLISESDKYKTITKLERVLTYKCQQCGHNWIKHISTQIEFQTFHGKTQNKPYRCPKCHSTKWLMD